MSTTKFTLPEIVAALNDGFQMTAAEAPVPLQHIRFTWPMAATLAHLNDPHLSPGDVDVLHDAVRDVISTEDEIPEPKDDGRTWTRSQVEAAVNWAIDEGAAHLRKGAHADYADTFALNAVLTLLDNPDATFEDITAECFQASADSVASEIAHGAGDTALHQLLYG
ncbi:hypothetical protein HHL19_35760 [Streptomyces sp. R302]|uniref:hypothetical protein n=1 Tax=unclassified Streptomyces TaxID=2593676 RepID=UPI00145FABAA|nr:MULTISPECIES: hypothetical protein [unclassified Streptomyces]NML55103.1 hypothetical protein [Streptomyces sp. R301]NML83867.1 hypothetical protein [Streptomyces sp. R302]